MSYFKRKKPGVQQHASPEKENASFIQNQAVATAIASRDAGMEKEEGASASSDASKEKEETAASTDAGMEKEEASASADASKEEEPGTSSDAAEQEETETSADMNYGETAVEEKESGGVASVTSTTPLKQTITSETPVEGGTQTKQLPDQAPLSTMPSSLDSLSTTLTHSPSVSQSGAVSGGNFGETNSNIRLINLNVTSVGTVHTVTADLEHTIWWNVRASTGPGRQKNITDKNDADITAANFSAVAADLTPNAYGRPTRSSYWSKSITAKHEKFHAYNQRRDSFGPQVNTAMQTWLNGQTVASAAEINAALMSRARSEGVSVYNGLIGLASTEGDAYADGKADYTALANSITAKGNAGGY